MGTVKLNRRAIDGLTVERGNRVFWDSELQGFGVRVHASGRKVHVAQTRAGGPHPVRVTVGRARIRERAGLEDMHLHDCRHSFASRALALGESLPMIGSMLGHSEVKTTARYAHLARDSVHEAGERVAARIEGLLERDCPPTRAASTAACHVPTGEQPDAGGFRQAASVGH